MIVFTVLCFLGAGAILGYVLARSSGSTAPQEPPTNYGDRMIGKAIESNTRSGQVLTEGRFSNGATARFAPPPTAVETAAAWAELDGRFDTPDR